MYGFLLTQHCILEAGLKVLKFQRQGRIDQQIRNPMVAAKPLDHVFAGNGASIFHQAAGVSQKIQRFSWQTIPGQEPMGEIKGFLQGIG